MSSYTKQVFDGICQQLDGAFMIGARKHLELIAIAYLNRGHVLIEGPPGTGKTRTAKLLAQVLRKTFKRIQFTSDLLPSDIIGAHIYSQQDNSFQFIQGPLFGDFVLADEVNRAPPRTQSALLEAMEEGQVTVEGHRFQLSPDFFVIATQNPRDLEGTFPLPEAQLDRINFKIVVDHLGLGMECDIIRKDLQGELAYREDTNLTPVQIDRSQIQADLAAINFDDALVQYIARILEATRQHPLLSWGASVRGGLALASSARLAALIEGRDFVAPDDIKRFVLPCLRHRVKLSPDAQVTKVTEADVVAQIIEKVAFPAR